MVLRFGMSVLKDNFVAELSTHYQNSAEFVVLLWATQLLHVHDGFRVFSVEKCGVRYVLLKVLDSSNTLN